MVSPQLNQICEGQQIGLKVAGSQDSVIWNTGQTGDSILVFGNQDLGISKKYWAFSESVEGCASSVSDTISVVSIPNPKPVFVNLDSVISRESLQNQNYCVAGLPGSKFTFSVTGGQKVDSSENCVTVNWTVPPSGARVPEARLPAIQATETLENPACSGSASQSFTYRPNLQIPTLITPNGDGKNETFEIEDLQFYASHRLQIFDRWGKKVLETSDYKNDWQGESGIYFYSLVVEGKQFSGWVMVEK